MSAFQTLAVASIIFGWINGAASAGDWPQILGPHRDGKAQQETLADSWPADGPKTVWRRAVGSGYSGAAVVGDACIVFHRLGDESIVERLDASTGKPRWKKSFPTHYVSSIAPDNGPRCTPIVQNDMVYLFGADGDLHALALADGGELWSRQLYKECGAPSGYFGAGSSPLVEGDLILVNVGGKDQTGIVALGRRSGKTVWHTTDELASYSSPVAITLANQRHAIFVARLNVVSLDPLTGAERFRFPFGERGPTVNAANPVVVGDRLFVTASYGIGARLMQFGARDAKAVWEKDDVLSSQYTTPIELDGYLYGIDGRQDAGVAELRCIELATGKVCWNEPNFGTGSLIAVANDSTDSSVRAKAGTSTVGSASNRGNGGKLLIQKTSGELVFVRPSLEKLIPLATAKLFPEGSVVQALPALSNGRYFVRNEQELVVVQLGK